MKYGQGIEYAQAKDEEDSNRRRKQFNYRSKSQDIQVIN